MDARVEPPLKILITGKNSYVGESLKCWLEKEPSLQVDELDVHGDKWRSCDLGFYSAIIHVAAIVHKKKGFSPEDYKRVNTDLTYSIAAKAKREGVRQFVFLSTMGVYGKGKKLPTGNIIDGASSCDPVSPYAKSKYHAELLLHSLEEDNFKVSIIRPPNIYGPECRGNYIRTLIRITKTAPVFPKIFLNSRQGLLYIDNLSELIRLIILNRSQGVFTPQDRLVPNTYEIIHAIAEALGKKTRPFSIPAFAESLFRNFPFAIKLFGGISYSALIARTELGDYNTIDFEEAIKRTVSSKKP